MTLFTALWRPDPAIEDLRGAAPDDPPAGWRIVDPESWHVALAGYGEAEPGPLARRLDHVARGVPAPTLRTTGAGASEGVRWAGVQAADPERLARLVELSGRPHRRYRPHVALLRRRPRPGPALDPDPPVPWGEHRGPWWRPTDLLLVSSEPARGGPRYRIVHRVPLAAGA
jgi:RNA 2',3'-cyclic 3'-phosphodiesterase